MFDSNNREELYHSCIEACRDSARACRELVERKTADIPDFSTNRGFSSASECEMVIQQTIAFMTTGSQYAPDICSACAEIFDKCINDFKLHNNPAYYDFIEKSKIASELCKKVASLGTSFR